MAPLSLAGSYPIRSQVLRLVPGSVHSCAYRPTKRPSYCGEVAIQCSIGGRYRIADTDCGPLGLVLTSNQSLQPPEHITTPASSAACLAFMVRTPSGCRN